MGDVADSGEFGGWGGECDGGECGGVGCCWRGGGVEDGRMGYWGVNNEVMNL